MVGLADWIKNPPEPSENKPSKAKINKTLDEIYAETGSCKNPTMIWTGSEEDLDKFLQAIKRIKP